MVRRLLLSLALLLFLLSLIDGASLNGRTRRFRRAIIQRGARRWANNVVPYEIYASLTTEQRANLTAAMNAWQRETCITFRPKQDSDTNWIRVVDGNRCHSLVGRHPDPGAQDLILETQCRMFGVILHELGHALGLLHEHNRPDRNDHIHVDTSNSFNNIEDEGEVLTYGTPYDLQSIMHYGVNEFPNNEVPRVSDESKKDTVGNVYHKDLSFFDVRAINLHYRCNAHCEQQNCPGTAFQNKSCQCEGPEDYADRRCYNLRPDAECNDRADRGDCDFKPVDMRHHCRKTCNTCFKHAGHGVHVRKKVCKDFETGCPGWATSGECQNNPAYMKLKCPKSCGECTPSAHHSREEGNAPATTTAPARECVDVSPRRNCATWRRSGNCNNHYRQYMNINCYKTCSGCTPPGGEPTTTPRPCVNTGSDSDCESWKNSGYCEQHQYEEWLRGACYRSCGYCQGPTTASTTTTTTTTTAPPPGQPSCEDSDSRCPGWASRGECQANRSWMRRNCRASCLPRCQRPTAPPACTDNHANCGYWASIGECNNNAGYMNQSCRYSCNLCPCRDEAVSCPINKSYCRLVYHFKKCRKTCESCSVCKDTRNDCPDLAASAYCRYATAIRDCPVSCGVCGPLRPSN